MKTLYLCTLSILALLPYSTQIKAQGLSSPFQLTSFTAEASNNLALVEWTTNIETNTESFTIDRTTDGTNYTYIGSVEAAGNSDFQHNYTITDNSPVQGTAYYRLTEKSLDGSINRYGMTPLTWTTEASLIKACYEKGHIDLHITSDENTTYFVQLVNTSGKVLIQQNYCATIGENEYSITPAVNDGIYIINVVSANIHYSKKLLLGSYSLR